MAKGDVETYFEDGFWKNRIQGNSRASSTHEKKSDAQPVGRKMAIDRGVEHQVKNRDGRIGQRNTYPKRRDRHPPKG